MFIPLHDANSLKRIKLQYVTIGLIAANVIVFLITVSGSEQFYAAATYGLGYIPSVAFDTVELPPELIIVPEDLTYVSYAFVHADIFHLGGNMLFLWVFGDNVEDALGHLKFLIFYLLCAAAGAAFHGLVAPDSQIPLIGASGAIAGVVTAYLILHPRVKIWVLAFARIPLRLPAYHPARAVDRVPAPDVPGRRRGPDLLGLPYRRHHRRRCPGGDPQTTRPADARPRGRHAALGQGRAAERGAAGRGATGASLGTAVIQTIRADRRY